MKDQKLNLASEKDGRGASVVKWFDVHFEEAILIFFLVIISCVELMQVVARNVSFIPTLTWAEELCRFVWIATVFISVPYTIRTMTALRVTALIEAFPWKVENVINIVVDIITGISLAVLAYFSVDVLQGVYESGELSPAMMLPMWIMYVIVFVGFALGVLRSFQMMFIHIKQINVPPKRSIDEQVEQELAAEKHNSGSLSEKDALDVEGGRS